MWKIVLIVILTSCGNAPKLPRPIKVWKASQERVGICRSQDRDVDKSPQCIPADALEFNNYSCISWDDLGVVIEYIETLIHSCKKWKK